MNEWHLIETVPKDGTEILAWSEWLGQLVVSFDENSDEPEFPWATLDGPSYKADAFSHWMTLPEPPK